ncbi:MAG: hypothetical protein GY765_22165, partial [bacterium]|nr:hypothetical protein [bacterium]
MKKRKKSVGFDQLPFELRDHIRQLELKSADEYVEWCRAHQCPVGLKKSDLQFQREYDIFKKEQVETKLREDKRVGSPANCIRSLYRGSLKYEQIKAEVPRLIYNAFRGKKNGKILLSTLLYLESKSVMLKDPACTAGIIALVQKYTSWIRRLEDWKPGSHNADRQFSSLARHLLAQYPVPLFLDTAFKEGHKKHMEWFSHIGMGGNIRKAEGLPIAMNKRIAHLFLQAPANYTVREALRWARVLGLGGDRRLVEALRETRLMESFIHDDFWVTVIMFFIRHPMLDRVHVGPIIDFIGNRKFENRRVFVARGVERNIGPEQPGFSMKGRTPDSLLRQVELWHGELGKKARDRHYQWAHSAWKDYVFTRGSREKNNLKIFRIRELVSSSE